MAIVASDIKFYKSTNGLGGVITANEITTATLHNLFDVVSSAESASGSTDYRCFYVKNTHATLALTTAIAYINAQPTGNSSIEFGLGTSAVDGTEQSVANELAAPTGVTFTELTGSGNSQAIGDITANGGHKAIWIKRIVEIGAAAQSDASAVITVTGDTVG